jgi:hypothetical protein
MTKTQEPVAWAVYDKRGGSKSLHWPEQHSPNGDATMFDAIPLVQQRPWVGLTEEERKGIWNVGEKKDQALRALLIQAIRDIEAKLKERNT